MRILIAPAPFKHSLSAKAVSEALSRGIRQSLPDAELDICPMADGGEGTVDVWLRGQEGERIFHPVHDPLMRPVIASFGIRGKGKTGLIEMCAASGIEQLKPGERDPLNATSYGTGELIRAALDRGCEKIMVGLGGSAGIDGGTGMAEALGMVFTDQKGKILRGRGNELLKIHRIHPDRMDPRIPHTRFIAACDVNNPLTGPEGAARVYGPQKGADNRMINLLESGLQRLAEQIKTQFGMEVAGIPGSGAAGGLGAGMLAFLGATLRMGFSLVSEELGLEERIRQCDLIFTGEGTVDLTSTAGKVVGNICRMAHSYGKPVWIFTGLLKSGAQEFLRYETQKILLINPPSLSLKKACSEAEQRLEQAARQAGEHLKGPVS